MDTSSKPQGTHLRRPLTWTLIATDDEPNMHRHDCDCKECRDEIQQNR